MPIESNFVRHVVQNFLNELIILFSLNYMKKKQSEEKNC